MYQALYRKYRPQTFDDVLGQKIVVETLKNSIKNKTAGHAYLFYGPRGTGKTTISKIFARAINCENTKDGNPCGKCESCLNSFDKECVDIIEMDAASNNGVEEIRELKSKISLVPAELKYKVYIIDEVHMLSMGAFNALLKTLEEPPEHAIFILATTAKNKIPDTIISRCQVFNFKRISEVEIVENLSKICKKEKIKVEDRVLKEIAVSSNGGMRDSIGNLDKLSSYSPTKITYNDYLFINELLSDDELEQIILSIYKNEVTKVINKLLEIKDSGKNIIDIIQQIMHFLRNIIIEYYTNNKESKYNQDEIGCFERLINLINEKMFDIKNSDNPEIYVEILFLKFMNTKDNKIISREIIEEEKPLRTVEKQQKSAKKIEKEEKKQLRSETKSKFNIINIKEIIDVRVNNTLATANKNKLNEEKKQLEKLKDYTFDQKIGYLVCEILNSKIRVVNDDCIVISYEYDSIVDQNLNNLENIEKVYNKLTDSNKKFAIISDGDWDKYKNEYIKLLKSGKKLDTKEEPNKIFNKNEKDDIISTDTIDLFSDIVEID